MCTANHSARVHPFCCSLYVHYSINAMRYGTLYYKLSFVLDDFTQADVSILNMFKVGEANLRCSVDQAY